MQLALKGAGRTGSNPLVGCVIVKAGKIISIGYHSCFGGPHAEAIALRKAGREARGATIYTNLEPCCDFKGKKTPSCAEALVKAGVRRAVFPMLDPNLQVNGRGMRLLKKGGVKVKIGLLKKEALQLNAPYFKFIRTGKPYVFLKVAMSLDAKISKKGRKYFSGKVSLRFAHKLRAGSDAILVGIGTVLKDNPLLTTRLVRGRDPLRIVLDGKLRIPLHANVLRDKNALLVAAKGEYPAAKRKLLESRGFEVLVIKGKGPIVDLDELLLQLGKRRISTLMIEGGSKVIASALNSRIVDKAHFLVVPEIFGEGTPLVGPHLGTGAKFKISSFSLLGKDLLVEAAPVYG